MQLSTYAPALRTCTGVPPPPPPSCAVCGCLVYFSGYHQLIDNVTRYEFRILSGFLAETVVSTVRVTVLAALMAVLLYLLAAVELSWGGFGKVLLSTVLAANFMDAFMQFIIDITADVIVTSTPPPTHTR